MAMLLGLHSIWCSRMTWIHGDVDARPTRPYFIESISQFVKCTNQRTAPLVAVKGRTPEGT